MEKEWWRRPALVVGLILGGGVVLVFAMMAATVGVFFAGGGAPQAGAGPSTLAPGVPARWGLETPDTQRVAWAAIVAKVGCPQLTRANWVIAVAIEIAESGANPLSHNPVPPDDSYGLWQINMLGDLGPGRRVEYGIASNDELFDAVTNAKAMCIVSGGGENWRPWSTFTNYAYWDHLPDAEAAVSAAEYGSSVAPTVSPARGSLMDMGAWCLTPGCQLDSGWGLNVDALLTRARADGFDIRIRSANRTYAEQAALYARNCPTPDCAGGLTAVPGTSNHEGGQAVDLARFDGAGLAGAGDPYWEEIKTLGPSYGVVQDGSIAGRDSVHFSATGF